MKKDTYKSLPLFHFGNRLKKMTQGNPSVLIFGNFGAYNIGDEAILAGQLHELLKVTKNITVVSRFPSKTKAMHNVPSVSMFALRKLINSLFRSNVVIVGGGGLFCKNLNGIRGILFQLYTILFFMFLPKIMRKHVVMLGIGVYANTNKIVLEVLRLIFLTIPLITVRDAHTYHLLRRLGIFQAQFYKDNSFLLPVSRESIRVTGKQNIGVALKKPSKMVHEQHFFDELITFMKSQKNATYWFFSMDSHPKFENDEKFHKSLSKMAKKNGVSRIHFVPTNLHPSLVLSYISQMQFMISMRLHSSIFAYRLRIPFVGISYDVKCSSFLTSIGKTFYKPVELDAALLTKAYRGRRVR